MFRLQFVAIFFPFFWKWKKKINVWVETSGIFKSIRFKIVVIFSVRIFDITFSRHRQNFKKLPFLLQRIRWKWLSRNFPLKFSTSSTISKNTTFTEANFQKICLKKSWTHHHWCYDNDASFLLILPLDRVKNFKSF